MRNIRRAIDANGSRGTRSLRPPHPRPRRGELQPLFGLGGVLPRLACGTSACQTCVMPTALARRHRRRFASVSPNAYTEARTQRRCAAFRNCAASAELGDEYAVRNLMRLPRTYWMLALACTAFYSAFLPFMALSTYGALIKEPRHTVRVLYLCAEAWVVHVRRALRTGHQRNPAAQVPSVSSWDAGWHALRGGARCAALARPGHRAPLLSRRVG